MMLDDKLTNLLRALSLLRYSSSQLGLPFRLDRQNEATLQRAAKIIAWHLQYLRAIPDEDVIRCRIYEAVYGFQPSYRAMLTLSLRSLVLQAENTQEQYWVETRFGPRQLWRWVSPRCEGITKAETRCRRRALFHQSRCSLHGGDKAAAEREIAAEERKMLATVLEKLPLPADKLAAAAILRDPVKPERLRGPRLDTPKWKERLYARQKKQATHLAPPEVKLALAASRA